MLGSKKATVTIRWNWLVLIAIFVVVLIGAFIVFKDERPIVVFVASVLAGASALTAAVNAMDARTEQAKHAKILVALDYVGRWNAPVFFHAKVNGRKAMKQVKGLTANGEFRKFTEECPAELQNLFDVVNFFEELSIAIQAEAADSEIARLFFAVIVSRSWFDTERFIKYRRAEKKNSQLLVEFEKLHTMWGD